MPKHGLYRPNVIYCVSKHIATSSSRESHLDPDCVVIDVFELKLVNIYNKLTQNVNLDSNGTIGHTIYRNFLLDLVDNKTLLLGDFTTLYPSWDPLSFQNTSRDYNRVNSE